MWIRRISGSYAKGYSAKGQKRKAAAAKDGDEEGVAATPEKKTKAKKEETEDDGTLSRQTSKLKRMLSQKSDKALSRGSSMIKKRDSQRIVSTSSEMALISNEDEENVAEEKGAVATLKAKAGSLKKSVGRSLRGGK